MFRTLATRFLAANEVAPGNTLPGGYHLIGPIGNGASSVVWLAEHRFLRSKRKVAIKVLRPDKAGLLRNRFTREFEINHTRLTGLDHVIQVMHADTAGDLALSPFIVMQYIDGVDLDVIVRQRAPLERLDAGLAAEITRQVALAVHSAHAKGVIHRDIKPANIIVANWRSAPDAWIGDFGIAFDGDHHTVDGTPMWTRAFAAPEQLRFEPVSHATDIYALGKTLAFALSGATTLSEAIVEHLEAQHVEAPAGLLEVIARATAPEPMDRFATMSDFAEALAPFCEVRSVAVVTTNDEATADPEGEPTELTPIPPPPRRSRAVTLAVVVAAAVTIGAGWQLGQAGAPAVAKPITVSDAALSLSMPAGWVQREAAVAGIALDAPLSLVSLARPEERIIAGRSTAKGPALLTPAALDALGATAADREAVRLTGFDAYRYEAEGLTVYVTPTSAGVLTLACAAPPATCASVARTLRLRAGHAFPLGQVAAYQEAMVALTDRLRRDQAVGRRDLRSARTRGAQSKASGALAERFHEAADDISAVPVSPTDADVHDELVASLRAVSGSYAALGTAAKDADVAAYRSAAQAVRRAERRTATALSQLTERGY